MELRQLEYFLTVAQELNFTRAAERLRITQPPLSLQIQKLEKELGIPLFYRNNRNVELTNAGKLFMFEADKIIEQLHRAVDNARRTHHGEIGNLTVGFVGSATYDILPLVLREFGSQFPDVQVQLLELSTPSQITALLREEIDVGVLRPPVHEENLLTEVVSSVPCVLAVPKQHPLVGRKDITLADLRPYPFVLLSRKTWAGLYDEILGLCNPMIRQEALEFQTVIGLVAAGLGISVVPRSAMNLHTQDVIYMDLNNQLPTASMGVSKRKNDQSPLVNTFIKMVKELAAST